MINKTKCKIFIFIAIAVVFAAVAITCFLKPIPQQGNNLKQNSFDNIILITSHGQLPVEGILTEEFGFSFYEGLSTSPLSLPSGASLITGKTPKETTIRVNGIGSIPQKLPTIATYLTTKKYSCGAFFSSLIFANNHGLTNGFAVYDSSLAISNNIPQLVTPAQVVLERASRFISKQNEKSKNAFVWAHVSEPIANLDTFEAASKVVNFIKSHNNSNTLIIYTPLSNPLDKPFAGLSLDECSVRLGINRKSIIPENHTISLMNIAAIIIAAIENKALCTEILKQPQAEAIMPWYAFNLHPKRVGWEGDWGLSEVKAQVLPSRFEAFTILAHCAVGEGLIPPYPSTNVLESVTNEVAFYTAAATARTNTIDQIKALITQYPNVPLFHYWLGEAYYNEGDYMEACNAYGKASHYGYNMLLAISRQSLCHTKLSNIPAAIERAETAYLLNPSDFVLRKELSSLLYSTGISMYKTENYDMAKECFNRVIWLTPTMLEPYLQMGHIHLKQGDTNAAESILNQALKLKPDFPPARKLLDSLK